MRIGVIEGEYEIKDLVKRRVMPLHCVMCQKLFFRRTQASVRRNGISGIRKYGSITCSPACSRNYTNLRRRFAR